MIIEIETHPLQPFLPENARLLMLGSFPPPRNKWKMDFTIRTFKTICGEFWFNLFKIKLIFK